MNRITKIISLPVVLMVIIIAILGYSWHYRTEAVEGLIVSVYGPETIPAKPDLMKHRVIPVFLVIMGVGVAGNMPPNLSKPESKGCVSIPGFTTGTCIQSETWTTWPLSAPKMPFRAPGLLQGSLWKPPWITSHKRE